MATATLVGVWRNQCSPAEREAFHRATCLNARDDFTLSIVQGIVEKFKAAMSAHDN